MHRKCGGWVLQFLSRNDYSHKHVQYIHMYIVHITYLHCAYVTCMLMILSNIHTPRMYTIRYKDNDKSYSPEEKAELFGTTGESVFIEQYKIFRCSNIFGN